MTKKSMHNQKLGLSQLEKDQLAKIQADPLKYLQKSYFRSRNALDVWEAITIIHHRGSASLAGPLEYPRWVQDYLREVAHLLLNADQDNGSSASFLARAIGVDGKRQALKRVADRKDFSLFLEVIAEQERLPHGKKEEAYGKVAERREKLDVDTVRKKCTKVRRRINQGIAQE